LIMSTRSEFLNYLLSYGTYLPVVLVWTVGIILSLVRWKRHPKISMLALLGLGGQLLLFAINTALNIWATHALYESTWTSEQRVNFYMVKSVISALIEAGLWVMLIYAIFAMRSEQRRFAEGNYPRPAPPTTPA
jgi:hypothetical protein